MRWLCCTLLLHCNRERRMHTKRTIALIGTNTLARVLATVLAKGNNRLLLFSRSFDEAASITNFIKDENALADIEAVPCSYDASWEADIIITTIPSFELRELAAYIKDVATQKVFIVSNLHNEREADVSMLDEVQDILPYTKIIEAFFNVNDDKRTEYSISGNDYYAALTAEEIFQEAGIHPQLLNSINILN